MMSVLPPVRKARSGVERKRELLNGLIGSQRKIRTQPGANLEKDNNPITSSKVAKEIPTSSNDMKIPIRIQRLKSGSKTNMQLRENVVPMFGDDKVILQAAQMVEKLNKLDLSQLSKLEINEINIKHLQLQSLLKEKCNIVIKENYLNFSQSIKASVRDLECLYAEEKNKLNFLRKYENDEKKKAKVTESFMKCSANRKSLPEEIDKKMTSMSLIKDTERLISIAHIYPIEEHIHIILEKTVNEIKRLRTCAIKWVELILQRDLEIGCILIDNINYDCISNICLACQSFNTLFSYEMQMNNSMQYLDLVGKVAKRQSSIAASKLSYFLHNELSNNPINESLQNKSANFLTFLNHDPDSKYFKREESTSDYFSASSSSLALPALRRNSSNTKGTPRKVKQAKSSKDLKEVIGLIMQANQKILLKLAFSHQESYFTSRKKSNNNNRQHWVVFEDDQIEQQQLLFRKCDQIFWSMFWKHFANNFSNCLFFGKSITLRTKAILLDKQSSLGVFHILEKNLNNEETELSQETMKTIGQTKHKILYELALQEWSQSITTAGSQMAKTNITVKETDIGISYVGTSVGIHLLKSLEALLIASERFVKDKNNINIKFVNTSMIECLSQETTYLFISYLERKSSMVNLSEHTIQLPYLALTFFDTNNLIENLNMIEETEEQNWKRESIESLLAIKGNGMLKFKQCYSDNCTSLLTASVPFREYRRKHCKSNSDWMEKIISKQLDPLMNLISKSYHTQAMDIKCFFIDEFASVLYGLVKTKNNLRSKFSPSGAIQFYKDIETFWDYIVTHNLQSTNSNPITNLKALSNEVTHLYRPNHSLVRSNKISPVITQNNQQQNIHTEINERLSQSCFQINSILNCFHF